MNNIYDTLVSNCVWFYQPNHKLKFIQILCKVLFINFLNNKLFHPNEWVLVQCTYIEIVFAERRISFRFSAAAATPRLVMQCKYPIDMHCIAYIFLRLYKLQD